MELGLFSRAYQHMEKDKAFQNIHRHSIRNVELTANRGSLHIDLDKALDREYRKEFERNLSLYELNITCLSLHRDTQLVLGPHGAATQHFFSGSAEEQINYGINRTKLAADVACEYNIPLVVGYLGCGDFSQWYPWPYKEGWKKQYEIAYERWMPILEHYEARGVKFAHEVGPQQIAYNLESAVEVCELLSSDSFGICFDPSNLILVGVDPVCFIEKLGGKILHVHGKDGEVTNHLSVSGWMAHGDLNREDRGFRFRVPGWGDVKWKKILTALKLNGYNGVISIEVEDPTMEREEAIWKAKDYLSPLLFHGK